MLAVATSLSGHFNFVRIDLYSNGEECLVGEITNCPGGATGFVANLYSSDKQGKSEKVKNLHGNSSGSVSQESAEVMASNIIFSENLVRG